MVLIPTKGRSRGPEAAGPVRRPDFADTSPSRRRNMAAVRGTDTQPELKIRRLLHRLGYRFRIHARELPGRPDVVFRSRRKAIFVNGCFWHFHQCASSVIPKTRREWWEDKLRRTVERDGLNIRQLGELGWEVLTIWECSLKDETALNAKLIDFLGQARLDLSRATAKTWHGK